MVSTSPCEAEYVSLIPACKEAVMLWRLLSDILEIGVHAMIVFGDKHSALKLADDEYINRRNEMIDITFHYVRDVMTWKKVQLEYEPINRNGC